MLYVRGKVIAVGVKKEPREFPVEREDTRGENLTSFAKTRSVALFVARNFSRRIDNS